MPNYSNIYLQDIYSLAHKKTKEEFIKIVNKSSSNIHNIGKVYDLLKLYDSSDKIGIIPWARSVLKLDHDMQNNNYEILPEHRLILGIRYDNEYLYRYESIVNPIIMSDSDFIEFITYFKKVIISLIHNPIKTEFDIKNVSLLKLVQVCRDIKIHHTDHLIWGNLVYILIAYSYCYDDSYELLYKFFDNPEYYFEKLNLDGYMEYCKDDSSHSIFNEDNQEKFFKNAKSVFINHYKTIN